MSFNNKLKINTKKKALKLIYDPVCLLRLLYSKYGDIEEDFTLLITNQLVYDTSSHLNIIFKEYQFIQNDEEFLKRWYNRGESSNRVPKLCDYYKNYHKFFCRPNFIDFKISKLMHNYGDDKAELFYKKNFDLKNSDFCEEIEISEKNNSSALSSIDNITNNKTIFNDKNKFIIEKDEKSINYSITLNLNNSTLNNIQNNKKNLISTRSVKNSFEEIVHNLVYYQKKKTAKNYKKKKKGNNLNDKNNKKESNTLNKVKNNVPKKLINTINYLDKNKIKNKTNDNNIYNKEKKYSIQLTKPTIINNHNNNNYNKINGIINNHNILSTILKAFNSPKNGVKGSRPAHKTKLEEYNNNCIGNIKKNKNVYHHRNKTYNFSKNYSLNNQSGDNMNHNLKNLISNKGLRKNSSQNKTTFNYILNFRDLTNKQIYKKKKKNKTFDDNVYTQINQISSMPFLKYKLTSSSNKKLNTQYKSNKNIIKNNNFIGSKFNLVKNLRTTNNFDKIKGKKHTPYNYYQNILTQILPENQTKKSKIQNITSFGLNNNNISNSFQKNKSISPINSNKNDKLSNNINDIKNRNKISKNQINNFNINFNNVFFTSTKPTSYIIDNNKNNSNVHAYSSIYVNKNNNNSLNGNNFINSNNILDQENKQNKNLYVMNLKNIYNFSRNKNNILINNNPLTHIEINHNKIQNNYNIIHIQKNAYNNNINKNKEAKTIFEKNINNNNPYGFEDINFNNKNQYQYHKNKSKKINQENQNQKIPSEIMNFVKKAQANFIMRNQNRNNLVIQKNNKVINTGDYNNKNNNNNLKNNKSFNCSKNMYSSSVPRKKNKSKIDINNYNKGKNLNDKKVSSLTSQKNIKSKHKRKIQ